MYTEAGVKMRLREAEIEFAKLEGRIDAYREIIGNDYICPHCLKSKTPKED